MFRGHGINKGLLRKLKERYEEADKVDVFEAAVGDGSLWAALVASLVNARWEGAGAEFEKALAIRELFREPSLLKTACAPQLLRYAKALRSKEATEMLTVHAPSIVEHLERIESELEPYWNSHLEAGSGSPVPVQLGDLLWRRGIGWAFGIGPSPATDRDAVRLRGNDTQVMKGYYLNVSQLGKQMPRINKLIECVVQKTRDIHDR